MLLSCPKMKEPRKTVKLPKNSTSQESIVTKMFNTFRRFLLALDESDNRFLRLFMLSLCTLKVKKIDDLNEFELIIIYLWNP